MTVTAKDVAEECGLSISTVSRALAEPDRVAKATRARVLEAADRLGYRPNRAASGLRAGRTGAIGLVVPDLENPYFASVAKGVQARARGTDHSVFIVDSGEDARLEAELVTELRDQTDGIVLCSPRAVEKDLELIGNRPVVLVNRVVEGVPSVTADEVVGTYLAVEHLRALGHRRIAYIGGPEHAWSDVRRRDGLARAMEPYPDMELVSIGSFRPQVEGGRAAADLVIASKSTAAIAYNDMMALGLIDRLRSRGVVVPRDLSVIGFDDTFIAQLSSPTLTSIHVGLTQLGAEAVVRLDGEIERRRNRGALPLETHLELPAELLVRDSTTLVRDADIVR